MPPAKKAGGTGPLSERNMLPLSTARQVQVSRKGLPVGVLELAPA